MAPKAKGKQGSIYAYETLDGTRWRFVFRDSRGKQSSRWGSTERRVIPGRAPRGSARRPHAPDPASKLREAKPKGGWALITRARRTRP
jgi:hypothetical protein